MTTVERLKARRAELIEQKKEEQACLEKGCGDSFAFFMIEEELIEVNAQLRSMTVGKRIGSRVAGSADRNKYSVDRQLYMNWAQAQDDDEVCSKGDMLREILEDAGNILTDKQLHYLREWSTGKTMTQVAKENGVSSSTVSRVITRGKGRMQKEAEAKELMQKQEGEKVIDLSDDAVARVILKTVTEKQAVYLYLYYGEWLSLREIAEIVGKSHQAVMKSIHAALKKIGDTLEIEYARLINVTALDEIAYSVYSTMSEEELLSKPAQKTVKRINLKTYDNRNREYVRKDRLPHIVVQYGDKQEEIWRQTKDRHTGGIRGKLLTALMERKKAGENGTLIHWLSAIFRRLKYNIKRKTGR